MGTTQHGAQAWVQLSLWGPWACPGLELLATSSSSVCPPAHYSSLGKPWGGGGSCPALARALRGSEAPPGGQLWDKLPESSQPSPGASPSLTSAGQRGPDHPITVIRLLPVQESAGATGGSCSLLPLLLQCPTPSPCPYPRPCPLAQGPGSDGPDCVGGMQCR